MIKINNKNYDFKFGFKAMLNFEEATGQQIGAMSDGFKLSVMVEIARAGLVDCELTKDELIDAIDKDMTLLTTMAQAFEKDITAVNSISEEAKK